MVRRRSRTWFAIVVALVGLAALAYIFNRPWLWILTAITWAVAIGWVLHRISRAVWDESGADRGRVFFLPRPSGLGDSGRPGWSAGFPGSIVFKQEKSEPGMPSEVEGYFPETAWTSAFRHKDNAEADPGTK